jgi:hypothetical protein
VFLHYQPYWNAQPGQSARTQQYKLYRDGSFFDVPEDLDESNDLNRASLSGSATVAKKMLTDVLGKAPPAPTEPGSRTTVNRPTYTDWPLIKD